MSIVSKNEMFSLAGKTALVTGSTGHLGRSMALALCEAGANLLVNGRDSVRCASLVKELKDLGYKAEMLLFDVTSKEQMDSAFISLENRTIDVLVNNAYSGAGGTIETSEIDEYRDSYEIVVSAAHGLFKACLPGFRRAVKQNGYASVINIASMYGMVSPDPRIYDAPESTNPPFYGAAKAALIQWTRYAACEFGKENIRVNSISPGPFPAPAVAESLPEFVGHLESKVPLGRIGNASELQGPLLFLASSASSYVTGSNLVVDGGWNSW